MRSCRLILWRQASKDKNEKQTDLFRCSSEMVHLINLNKKFHYISVNKLPTIGNRTPLSVFRDIQIVLSSCMIEIRNCFLQQQILYPLYSGPSERNSYWGGGWSEVRAKWGMRGAGDLPPGKFSMTTRFKSLENDIFLENVPLTEAKDHN